MNPMVSYAQNGEDVLLRRVFGDADTGFYVDIGASHPEKLSVTKYFYDMGWRGINVDPLKGCMELFEKSRPDDINLNLAIDMDGGALDFYEVTSYPELSTFSEETAEALMKEGHEIVRYAVDRITGNKLFDQYVQRPVDFLKIDVEGYEYEVIRSIDFKRHRPKVLVIEATIPNASFPGWQHLDSISNFGQWEPVLLDSGYIFAYFDGLNRFYVREEDKGLLDCFQIGLCLWDNYILYPQAFRIEELERQCAERLRAIETLTPLLKESEADRAARFEQIESLTAMLKASEADRAERQKQIEALVAMLKESEAARIEQKNRSSHRWLR